MSTNGTTPPGVTLVTGASGYVGGRLVAALEREGATIRCLTRRPEFMASRVSPGTEVCAGDVTDRASLDRALAGVHTAYYLVHSMASGATFAESDRHAAKVFGEAAHAAGVARVIYLGGLADDQEPLSLHMRSRHEVGTLLRAAGLSVVELRASVIIGSGSLSFEIVRALTERLPFMLLPRWVSTPAQPIAITDVVQYLLEARKLPPSEEGIFEIGGADQVSYEDMMRAYAAARGLHVPMFRVPVLTPFLSSLWLGLVTPIYARVGRALIASIMHPSIMRDDRARRTFAIQPMPMADAIRHALVDEDQEIAASRWSDALSSVGEPTQWGGVRFGNRLVDSRQLAATASTADLFNRVQRIGGAQGWYAWNVLWWIRGLLDLLVGGAGMRRGRRHPVELRVGDTLDCWRVERLDAGRLLRLTAEMKLPGRAWLEFEVTPTPTGSTLRQTAIFDPVGVLGQIYWYSLFPLHELVFGGMLREIVRSAESGRAPSARPPSVPIPLSSSPARPSR